MSVSCQLCHMLFILFSCKYHQIKTKILNLCLMFISWSWTQDRCTAKKINKLPLLFHQSFRGDEWMNEKITGRMWHVMGSTIVKVCVKFLHTMHWMGIAKIMTHTWLVSKKIMKISKILVLDYDFKMSHVISCCAMLCHVAKVNWHITWLCLLQSSMHVKFILSLASQFWHTLVANI